MFTGLSGGLLSVLGPRQSKIGEMPFRDTDEQGVMAPHYFSLSLFKKSLPSCSFSVFVF